MNFTAELQAYRERVEKALDAHVPKASTPPARLHEAMRYSLEAGGKRLRPVLVLAAADLFGAKPGAADAAAVAVECIHTYSLIHDDLPCMDNDDLRRGRPTAHKQFDEATALLAGDALLTHAFHLLATGYRDRPVVLGHLVAELGHAASSERLIGGQMEDLLAEKKSNATADELRSIHVKKTGAMIIASLAMGGLVADASGEQLTTLRIAGAHLGLAFQIIDDILDATADSATLGKTAGKDAKADKTTYVKLHGLPASRQHAREQTDAALAAFAKLPGGAPFLTALAQDMAARNK
ncbi:MAG TPA: farnesyl diphosphate synthase [Candidatus Didemnitutus sp.]|nr:farnesyl diphosphate synthase [Candidatus Didemnitutus sp.]